MKMRISPWQIAVLVLPIVAIVVFLLIAAGQQIRAWGLNWIWAVVIFVLLGWRWLIGRWTNPMRAQAEALVSQINADLEAATDQATAEVEKSRPKVPASTSDSAFDGTFGSTPNSRVEAALTQTLELAQADPPIWEDWPIFWQRCLSLVTAVAQAYHPELKRPLLNIYVPEAYGLIRGTVDDTDRMMQKLSPVLSQISIGQMVAGVELYQKLEPSAKKLMTAFNWAQWVLNPVAAIARQTSAQYSNQANQQILLNLSNLLREATLRNLAQQAVALYGGGGVELALSELAPSTPALASAKTQTLGEILERAEPVEAIEQKPLNILLIGRTGAGKSSVINTLFRAEAAMVDALPSTDKIQSYRWQAGSTDGTVDGLTNGIDNGTERLTLWDTPGYEQVARPDLRDQVLDYASQADLLLLVTPALDPALQMDADFLREMRQQVSDLPVLAIVNQVDKLRPIREWSPPYHWRTGAWPKETAIRAAVAYRAEQLGEYCTQVLPLVASNPQRTAWGDDELATALVEAIAPTKQLRLTRFLRSQSARTTACATIIDRYSFQMTTTEGLAKLLKSPVLQFVSTLTTGTPALGALLTAKIPVEEVPIVLGKLQMAYELFSLLSTDSSWRSAGMATFDLLSLWPLLLRSSDRSADQQAWALGHALVEYWTQTVPLSQLESRVAYYLDQPKSSPSIDSN